MKGESSKGPPSLPKLQWAPIHQKRKKKKKKKKKKKREKRKEKKRPFDRLDQLSDCLFSLRLIAHAQAREEVVTVYAAVQKLLKARHGG